MDRIRKGQVRLCKVGSSHNFDSRSDWVRIRSDQHESEQKMGQLGHENLAHVGHCYVIIISWKKAFREVMLL